MKADKQFDFYEFAGIVMPGAILIAGLAQAVPNIGAIIAVKDMTLGTLGLFVILSYAAGHLVQTVGNALEGLYWLFSGIPTDWIRTGRGHLLSQGQRTALEEQVPKKLGLRAPFAFKHLDKKEWFSITRQIYAAVAAANRANRIDVFNGNYGLNRGLAASLLLVAAVVIIQDHHHWPYSCGLALAALAGIYRMQRFARHYARELFVQFLQLPLNGTSDTKSLIVDPSTKE
jgi:hypothetical protein